MSQNKLGKFISSVRLEKKMTQEQLAEKLNVCNKTISKWECGTSQPDFDTLIKIGQELDISLDELSLCKRIPKDDNDGEKGFKRFLTKRNISIFIFVFIFLLLSLFSIIYTTQNYNSEKFYQLKSMNEDYTIEGTYYKNKNSSILTIKHISYLGKEKYVNYTYEYEILVNENRIYFVNTNETSKYVVNSKTVKLFNISLNSKDIELIHSINSNNLKIIITYTDNKKNKTIIDIPVQLTK